MFSLLVFLWNYRGVVNAESSIQYTSQQAHPELRSYDCCTICRIVVHHWCKAVLSKPSPPYEKSFLYVKTLIKLVLIAISEYLALIPRKLKVAPDCKDQIHTEQ